VGREHPHRSRQVHHAHLQRHMVLPDWLAHQLPLPHAPGMLGLSAAFKLVKLRICSVVPGCWCRWLPHRDPVPPPAWWVLKKFLQICATCSLIIPFAFMSLVFLYLSSIPHPRWVCCKFVELHSHTLSCGECTVPNRTKSCEEGYKYCAIILCHDFCSLRQLVHWRTSYF
jgi:hypothetical protein